MTAPTTQRSSTRATRHAPFVIAAGPTGPNRRTVLHRCTGVTIHWSGGQPTAAYTHTRCGKLTRHGVLLDDDPGDRSHCAACWCDC